MINYEKILLDLVTPMVEGKTNVSVKMMPTLEDNEILLYVYANNDDVAHLIGRRSMMASSIRQMMSVVSRREDKRVTTKSESYQDTSRVLLLKVGHMKGVNAGMLMSMHSLRGEMKVKVLTDLPQLRFQGGTIVHLQLVQGQFNLEVQHVRENKGQLLVKFEGYDDINQMESWKGSVLTIRKEELQELDEFGTYFHELQDAVVYDMEDAQLGTVNKAIETGASTILRVKTKDKDILVPFVRAFIREFGRRNKVMKMELMEGLV